MQFSRPITEIIKKRRSVRIYDKAKRLDSNHLEILNTAAAMLTTGIQGEAVKFTVFPADSLDQKIIHASTYGSIVDPHAFIVGKIKKGSFAYSSFGYLFEQLILKATDLGLGTCWLGYYRRELFQDRFAIDADEIIPAISPVGYSKEKGFHRERLKKMIRFLRRRPFSDLFFENNFTTSLDRKKSGIYGKILEMVRRAPSAGNLQPWKIIKTNNNFHFYLDASRSNKEYNKMKLQHIDMGIAMCHFELAAQQLGIEGKWKIFSGPLDHVPDRVSYIVSFSEF